MRLHSMFLMLIVLLVSATGPTVFSREGLASALETATGPEGLLRMEQQGTITVRALRGWGRLPDKYVGLAQRMRQEAGLDLLGADLEQIRLWGTQDDTLMAPYRADLIELAAYMERGEHLQWTPAAEGASVPAGTLMRNGDTRWTQAADGPATVPAASAPAEPSQSAQVSSEPDRAELAPSNGTDAAAFLAPGEPNDSGPAEGVEFAINDQLQGTYRVRLQAQGVTVAGPQDDPYFQRRLQPMLPGSPAVAEGEARHFDKLAENIGVKAALDGNVPYSLVLGFVTADTPVIIRVDAPENPEIPLSEKEVKDGVSYRVAGKSVYVYRHDDARGDADIGFEESRDGEVRWTPRVDPSTGRPVGPRAFGVYMSYRVKKYIGDNELGTLSTRLQRIGWVVTAMPGDVYEHEGTLYAVGQDESLSTGAPSGPVAAAENFDFELPQYALDKRAIKLSDDLRHVAWVEGEKEGKKRVVVNGVPGKWYDDVKGYSMLFTPQGETFCFEAELGDKEIPVCNGADGPVFDEIDFLTMSDDGAHVLVGGGAGDANRIHLDGRQVRETRVSVQDGAVARNGKAAWIERGRDEHNGAEFAMVVTADGAEGQKYPAVHGKPVFTQNRADLYYIAEKEGGDRFLVRDAEELKPTMGTGYKFTVTPDGAYYAYVAHVDDKIRAMVVNGQIGPDFEDIWDPATFSPDGSRHVYEAKKGGQAYLVVDGQVFEHDFGALESVAGETFSPDGRHWAAGFQIGDGEYVVVVDGKEVGRGQGSPRSVVFSPDGTKVAWLEKGKSSWRAFLDGQAGPEFREIFDDEPPQFSPDGRHLVYFALDTEKKVHIVVFGGEDRVHDIIPPRAVFAKGVVEYLAVDGNRFRRQSIPLD